MSDSAVPAYSESVGLVGVGVMGRVILARLIEAGSDVAVYDVNDAAVRGAEQRGARGCRTIAELVDAVDTIILSLPAPQHIAAVVSGPGGIAESAGADHLVIDTSTVDPETTRSASAALSRVGAYYLDAPILGRPASIGHWVLPVGGDSGAFDRARKLLSIFAKSVLHVGPSGSGNTLKLVNQLMFSIINAATAEAFAVARRAGLDARTFYETVAGSGAATVSGLFVECGRKVVNDDYDPVFPVRLLCKDAGLAVEMAKSVGVSPIVAGVTQTINEAARDVGYAEWDTSALARFYDQIYEQRTPTGRK